MKDGLSSCVLSTLHESVRSLLRNALKLTVIVVGLDFLMWGVAIELPAKYWEYLVWRVPPINGLGEWRAELKVPFLVELLDWWAHVFSRIIHTASRTIHTALYLVAILNVSILMFRQKLSTDDTLAWLSDVKTWGFLRALGRTTGIVLLFVVVAAIGVLLPLDLMISGLEATGLTATGLLVLAGVVVALANLVLSRYLLIAPVCVLESAGFDSFRKSWQYTENSRVTMWLLYTIHTTALFGAALLFMPSGAKWLLPICVVWHAALSVKCYTDLHPRLGCGPTGPDRDALEPTG